MSKCPQVEIIELKEKLRCMKTNMEAYKSKLVQAERAIETMGKGEEFLLSVVQERDEWHLIRDNRSLFVGELTDCLLLRRRMEDQGWESV